MALSQLIKGAEKQRKLLSQYSSIDRDGQIESLKTLNGIYLENSSTIASIVEKHEHSIEQDCRPILNKAKAMLEKLLDDPSKVRLSFRRSFEAIYISPPARDSESRDMKMRNNRQHDRALHIQGMGCDSAMMWAGALTTSEWANLMTSSNFNYVLKNMPKPPQECLQGLLKILEAWENEQPLVNCAAFTSSLTALRARSNEITSMDVELPTLEEGGHEQRGRPVLYAFSNLPFNRIQSLSDKLHRAIMHSRQIKMERRQGRSASSCVTIFIPDDEQQDGSVNIVIDRDIGFEIQKQFELQRLTLQ